MRSVSGATCCTIFQDYGVLVFDDVLFKATIRRLDSDEVADGSEPCIKIWMKGDDSYGPVAEVRKKKFVFKVRFEEKYSHNYSVLGEMSRFIGWVVGEVEKNSHYMLARLVERTYVDVVDESVILYLDGMPDDRERVGVGDVVYGKWDGVWWRFRVEKTSGVRDKFIMGLGFKAALSVYDIGGATHIVKK